MTMKTDKYSIDSHKLMYHTERVQQWLEGRPIYPIYIEISPYGGCNHRCIFCALDFMGYKKIAMDLGRIKDLVAELAWVGVKSIMYAGEGEPLLHPEIVDIIRYTKTAGLDVALTTNVVNLTEDIALDILPYLSWVKASVNAGTAKTYAKIHRCKESDFDLVIDNLVKAIELKKEFKWSCAIGMQMVLLPENSKEVLQFAGLAYDMKLDYSVVKQYSQHQYSNNKITSGKMNGVYYDLSAYNTVLRKVKHDKTYNHCYGLPFWSYISTDGSVWGCSAYLGNDNFCYGNIYDRSFSDIWNGGKRLGHSHYVENEMSVHNCRINCRMDNCNEYLWNLKHPVDHVNFI